ncbi:MAG: 16S rRNA (cytidine(1402)-2'-O)-methyltransferase [Proteobacteria bacterium]|nr:16S rRNA (cytidine(1402)-2'-O)-methyltransferase [Pseudomonadota bacterium]
MKETQPIEARTLYIVATPIGNLGDMSQRALDVLSQVDFVLCEDTRHSGILLEHFGIRKRVVSYFAHNEALRTDQFMPKLLDGESAALITDAGTPGISDPGSRLVDACLEAGVRVCPIPGACAVPTAVSACGFYLFTGFEFVAFFPRKSSERRELFEAFVHRDTLLVGYESPQRIASLLEDLVAVAGPDRRVCLCRELTKKFESIERMTACQLLDKYREEQPKGELCLIVEGEVAAEQATGLSDDAKRLIALLKARNISARDIRDIVSEYCGVRAKDVYQAVIGAT